MYVNEAVDARRMRFRFGRADGEIESKRWINRVRSMDFARNCVGFERIEFRTRCHNYRIASKLCNLRSDFKQLTRPVSLSRLHERVLSTEEFG